MNEDSYTLDECKVKAKTVSGGIVEFDLKYMTYDSREDIYWYKDEALNDIEILDPNGNPQTKYKTFQ